MATTIKQQMQGRVLTDDAREAISRVLTGSDASTNAQAVGKLTDAFLLKMFAERIVASEHAKVLAVREPVLQAAMRNKAPKMFTEALRAETMA